MEVGDHQEDRSAKCQALTWKATLVIMQARLGVVPPPVSPTQEVEAGGCEFEASLGLHSKLQGNMDKKTEDSSQKSNHQLKKLMRIKGRKTLKSVEARKGRSQEECPRN